MAATPAILAFAGSTRRESFNGKLIRVAADAARAEGTPVTLIDLRDFPLPLFDQDLEAGQGMPPAAVQLQDLFLKHQGLLISAPEYNSSITPLLKNTIDWATRPEAKGEPALIAFKDKVAGLVSASPGALGGLRGLVHLRSILGNIGVLVLPTQFALSRAGDAFSADGSLKDPKQHAAVADVAQKLARALKKLGA